MKSWDDAIDFNRWYKIREILNWAINNSKKRRLFFAIHMRQPNEMTEIGAAVFALGDLIDGTNAAIDNIHMEITPEVVALIEQIEKLVHQALTKRSLRKDSTCLRSKLIYKLDEQLAAGIPVSTPDCKTDGHPEVNWCVRCSILFGRDSMAKLLAEKGHFSK